MPYIYPILQNGQTVYRLYFVHHAKKLYLGYYKTESDAQAALKEAQTIMQGNFSLLDYTPYYIPFKKYISLCNFRDNKVYIKNPIYIYPRYFCYFLSPSLKLTFDMKELMYFSSYKIFKRGNYIYTQDAITQQSILSRFGIPPHSVMGVDYRFKNEDCYDFRAENLEIFNSYKGVSKEEAHGQIFYSARIFVKHNLIIGHYQTELEAAIAYNKAIDLLKSKGFTRDYIKNEIAYLTLPEYKEIYDRLSISPVLLTGNQRKRVTSFKKYRGISKDKSGFRASIGYKSKQFYLGIYPTEKRAAQAYNFASFYLYGHNGHVNPTVPTIYEADTQKIASYLKKYDLKNKV
ncbi:hypothetical protein CS063_05980 [Sporanaerobium hydrogeniformans]|uniref:Uncharacterized protein n=1 Tax=Sporanaerobium hydrogeniformans TaxID=3072179 RepID=A0AC61DDW4_9FIRM|nr:hypothetical protein [Sporanaerobium hydrogeniformans]PHV71238.1 hypothetical protein CS063_05980 [Sporanaerobium hydrogeniformans]